MTVMETEEQKKIFSNNLNKYILLMKVSPHTRDFSHELGDTI